MTPPSNPSFSGPLCGVLGCGRGGVPLRCSPVISVSDPLPGSLCFPLKGELESCLAGDLLPYGRLSTSGTL